MKMPGFMYVYAAIRDDFLGIVINIMYIWEHSQLYVNSQILGPQEK